MSQTQGFASAENTYCGLADEWLEAGAGWLVSGYSSHLSANPERVCLKSQSLFIFVKQKG